jgi:hypothetical protein
MTVDDHLGTECVLREQAIVLDIESVGEGRGGAVSPARPTVNWDMLVSGETEVIGTVDVSPIPTGWKSLNSEVLVRSAGNDSFGQLISDVTP